MGSPCLVIPHVQKKKKKKKKKIVNKLHGDNRQSIKWHGPQNKFPAACEEMNKWLKLQLLQKAISI